MYLYLCITYCRNVQSRNYVQNLCKSSDEEQFPFVFKHVHFSGTTLLLYATKHTKINQQPKVITTMFDVHKLRHCLLIRLMPQLLCNEISFKRFKMVRQNCSRTQIPILLCQTPRLDLGARARVIRWSCFMANGAEKTLRMAVFTWISRHSKQQLSTCCLCVCCGGGRWAAPTHTSALKCLHAIKSYFSDQHRTHRNAQKEAAAASACMWNMLLLPTDASSAATNNWIKLATACNHYLFRAGASA